MKAAKPSLHDLDRQALAAHQAGRPVEALRLCAQSIKMAPSNDALKMRYAHFFEGLRVKEFDLETKITITACLKCPVIDRQRLGAAWCALLFLGPPYRFLFENGIDNRKYWKSIDALLNDDFMIYGLRALIISSPTVERAFTKLRKTLLMASQEENMLRGKHLSLLGALAVHCYLGEYVWAEGDDEKRLLKMLDLTQPAHIALLGCYRPLPKQPQARIWADTLGKGPLAPMVQIQLFDYFEELEIKKTLKPLAQIEEHTSRAVQEMYEENPYPRWSSTDIPFKQYHGVALDWLTAGCGTGRPITQASKGFPDARITAIDLSRSSLAYAVRKTREQGVSNIDFYHGDLLNIGKLGKDFDFIESSGVLHHMKDPVAGWRALLACLRPGGRMQIGLYSTAARDIIYKVRAYIKEKNYPADAEGIRALRADIMARPKDDPLYGILSRHDFYAASECRDLVFHIQETTYTIPEIRAILDELDLAFLGFKLRANERDLYIKNFPNDPAMLNLDNWHALEQQFPSMFIGMYKFFCCRRSETESPRPEYAILEKTGFLQGR